MVAEMELSKVDNKTKLETTLQEEAAIQQDNKDREMERLADAAEKAARVTAPPHWLLPGASSAALHPFVLCFLLDAGGGTGAGSSFS